MSNKLHFYTLYNKEKIKIATKPFASGGEGAIYSVVSPRTCKHLVAKIYYPEKRTKEREAKMKYLMQHPPIQFQENELPSIGWVQDLIYKDRQFIGILLIRFRGKKLTKLTLFKLPRKADKAWKRFAFGQAGALKLRLRTCFNLAVVLQQIHAYGRYVLVDLKPDNVLMQPNGLITLVDMDSVEVIEQGKAIFSAPVATPEYTPPEYYNEQKLDPIEENWDRFSMGVIFYQLLFGLHPFAAASNPPYDNLVSLNDKIQHGLYVHHAHKQNSFKVVPPPHQQFYTAPIILQELFKTCFESGHNNPEIRPTASDWCEGFANLLKLPFTKYPKLQTPPSTLYFMPSNLVKGSNYDRKPKLLINRLTSKERIPIPLYIDGQTPEFILKKAYQGYLVNNRNAFGMGFVLMTMFLFLFFNHLPTYLLLGIAVLVTFGLQFLFSSTNKTIINKIGKELLAKTTYQLLDSSEYDQLEQPKIQAAVKKVNAFLEKGTNLFQQKLEGFEKGYQKVITPQDQQFIQDYFQKRIVLQQKIQTLKDSILDADVKMIETRRKELKAYETTKIQYQKQLLEEPLYQSYAFHSYSSLHLLLERTIEIEENVLKKLNLQTFKTLNERHQQEQQALNDQIAQEITTYQLDQSSTTGKRLAAFEALLNTPSKEEKNYIAFVTKRTALNTVHQTHQTKLQTNLEQSLMGIEHKLNLSSNAVFQDFLTQFKELPENDKFSFLQEETQKQLGAFRKQIIDLNIQDEHLHLVLDLLKQKIPAPIITHNYKYPTDFDRLLEAMLRSRSTIQQKISDLNIEIQELTSHTTLASNPVELAYWIKQTSEHIQDLHFLFEQHNTIQEQIYSNLTVYKLSQALISYQKDKQETDEKIKHNRDEYLQKLKQLEAANTLAIEYQKQLPTLRLEKEKVILAKKQEFLEQDQKDFEIFDANLKQKQATNFQALQQQQEKELADLREKIAAQKQESQQKHQLANDHLQHLTLSFEQFQTKVKAIQEEAEQAYRSQKTVIDQQLEEIEALHQFIQQNHSNVKDLLLKHDKIIYQKEKIEQEYFDKFKPLQEEKIRLDTLLEWQENYSSKIYIKDLLLNKLEQFQQKNPPT